MSGKDPAVMRLELARMLGARRAREAVGAIERAARDLPDPDALLALVDSCLRGGSRPGDAVDLAARLAGLRARDPGNRRARVGRPAGAARDADPGEALRRAGSLGEALAVTDSLLRRNPGDRRALRAAGFDPRQTGVGAAPEQAHRLELERWLGNLRRRNQGDSIR